MPVRNENGAQSKQPPPQVNRQPPVRTAPAASTNRQPPAPNRNPPPVNRGPAQRQAPPPPQQEGDDVWDDVMNMKTKGQGGDDDGFNKFNTGFYLREGETANIVLMDENPVIFWGHVIKCKSKKGSTYFLTEQCQKSESSGCVMCDSSNPAVGKARKVIAFRILDERGTWVTPQGATQGDWDWVPKPKIFLPATYVAKQFKQLKDEAGGTISDKVIKLSKNGNYLAQLSLEKGAGGGMFYVQAPEYDGEMPDILEVYAIRDDRDLIDFIHTAADASGAQQQNNNNGAPPPGKKGFGRN